VNIDSYFHKSALHFPDIPEFSDAGKGETALSPFLSAIALCDGGSPFPRAPNPLSGIILFPGVGNHRRTGEGFAMAALIAKPVNNSHVRSAGAGHIPAPAIAK
jgi:hypothetical protein